MPPSIHPVDLISSLREKHLTPAIVFLTSRRACDEAMQAFDHADILLPPLRQQAIAAVLEKVIAQYPSIAEHPLLDRPAHRRGRASCRTSALVENRR